MSKLVSKTRLEINVSFFTVWVSLRDKKRMTSQALHTGALTTPCAGQPPLSHGLLRQGDRTILTSLLILSHSAFSAASTKTPHERRRAQGRAPEPVWVSMPPRWSSLPDSPARGTSPRVELQPCLIGHRAAGFGPGQQYDEVGAITLGGWSGRAPEPS